MRFLWLSFFLCFSIPFSAFAGDDCATVDLRPLIGPPMHQGDSGYCFAHTSASLIRAKLGVAVSPMQLAVTYILTNPEELSGPVDPRVRKQLTPEFFTVWKKDRSLEPQNYSPQKILTEEGLLNTGGEEVPTLLAANFQGLCPESRLPTGESVYKEYLSSIRAFHRERVLEGIPREETERPIGEVLDPIARGMAWSYRHWVKNRCGDNVRPAQPLIPASVSFARDLKQFRQIQALSLYPADQLRTVVMRAVDRQLDRGQPVSFGYAMSDLIPEKLTSAAPSAEEVDHASVFAGRKKMNGRCYYFVRNSFGTELEGYRPQFRGRLEDGGAWVLPEELPSLYSAVWLE